MRAALALAAIAIASCAATAFADEDSGLPLPPHPAPRSPIDSVTMKTGWDPCDTITVTRAGAVTILRTHRDRTTPVERYEGRVSPAELDAIAAAASHVLLQPGDPPHD